MDYRQLGDSSLKISVITFGAWAIGGTMWGGNDEQDAIDAIQTSIDLGVTSIDTAPIYGFGKSEELVARAIKGRRDKVQLFTKFGLRWDSQDGEYFFELQEDGKTYPVYRNAKKKSIIEECENSLRRLQTDYIDLYQCHWRDHSTPVEETMEAMQQLLKDGKIRTVGVSNFTAEEIDQARAVVPIASNQPPYSMVLRNIERDVLPFCKEQHIGVIVYSPLQRGLLTGKFKPDHKFAAGDHRATQSEFQSENIKRVNTFLEKLVPFAEKYGVTVGQLVINWTIHVPGITAALVGARNSAQAKENAAAYTPNISSVDLQSITILVDQLTLVAKG